ncbi:hypothetical protein PVAP13_9NG225846 [Panicum virgatum]|uniref:BED-type domain-containing protein n=1 Tax=Panicum virgatum TaxID=38727 RepID=A0A8T0MIA3_PANVG|nr:hypothetical protein PVAP13_9NG225846 [Panicum virgatum]
MAMRHQRAPLRNSAGGQGRPSGPSELRVAMAGADVSHLHGFDSQAEEEDLKIEDDDDIREDAAALFSIDVGDDGVPNNNVINVDGGDGGGAAAELAGCCSMDTQGTTTFGKHKSSVWADFKEVKENDVRVAVVCNMCGKRLSARSSAGTGHLIRHQSSCRKKT